VVLQVRYGVFYFHHTSNAHVEELSFLVRAKLIKEEIMDDAVVRNLK
jgi:hypothetical protein